MCLCVDGFRKVMHIDTGIVKQERDGPVEFQHPYFRQGQDDLLENIKRKVVSSTIVSCKNVAKVTPMIQTAASIYESQTLMT